MRTIWNGTLHFGLVRIPVGLAPTSTPGEIEFRTLHRECGSPVKQKRWCEVHERLVEKDELVKGWEIAPGEYVLVEEEELAGLEPETSTRAIELVGFIGGDEIDLVALDRCYYLAPSESPVGRRPYAVFSDALTKTNTAALVRFVAWNKERLAIIRPLAEEQTTLVLHTLRYSEELCPPEDIERAFAGAAVDAGETKLAQQLVRRLDKVDPATVENTYARRVQRLLEDKIAGKKIVRAKASPRQAADEPPADLASALRKSVRAAKPAAKPRKKPAPARTRRKTTKT